MLHFLLFFLSSFQRRESSTSEGARELQSALISKGELALKAARGFGSYFKAGPLQLLYFILKGPAQSEKEERESPSRHSEG